MSTMTSKSGIEYTELRGSKTGQFSRASKTYRERIFKCAWADLDIFLVDILGQTLDAPGGLNVELPMRFDGADPNCQLYADTVAVRPFKFLSAGPDGSANYEAAILTVSFQALEHDPSEAGGDTRWATISVKSHVEYQPIPANGLKWAGGAELAPDFPAFISVIYADLIIARYNLTTINEASITAQEGKLNSATFMQRAAKKLQFAGYEYERDVDERGRLSKFTLYLHFKYRSVEWDKHWKENAAWTTVTLSGGGALFSTFDFNNLVSGG